MYRSFAHIRLGLWHLVKFANLVECMVALLLYETLNTADGVESEKTRRFHRLIQIVVGRSVFHHLFLFNNWRLFFQLLLLVLLNDQLLVLFAS